jgi:predicted dehydrogenase
MDRRSFLRTGGALAAAALGATKSQAADTAAGGSKMFNVAMLSGWHAHAKGYGEKLSKMPDVKVTTVWDEKPERGEAWAKTLKADFVPDLAEVFKRKDVDGVAICGPSNMHADIMVQAANAGKHIFTEKVMALTVAECNRVSEAVKKAGVKFCISFPYLTRPQVMYAKKAVDDGLLGTVTLVRARIAHDAGCHGWLPPHFWHSVGSSRLTMISPQSSQCHAGMRCPHQSWREMHQSRMFSSQW